MSLVRVYIATTAGPVAIQRITEEDADVNSVICLAGKAVALPISYAYDAFVRNPTGVVQRHFGHNAYRIDVSEKIDEGYSWQLGVFTAHALQRARRLAGPKDAAATVVVATGELDRDLTLHEVDGVAEKIARLEAALATLVDDAARLVIAVPAGTEIPWRHGFADIRLATGTTIEIVAAAVAKDLLGHLDVALPAASKSTQPASTETPGRGKRRGRVLALAAALALAAMAAAAGGAVYAPEIRSWVAELTEPSQEPAVAPKPQSAPKPALEPVPKPAPVRASPSAPTPKAEAKTEKPPPPPEPAPTPSPVPTSVPQAEPVAAPETDRIPSKPAPPRKPATVTDKRQENDRIEEARLPDLGATGVRVTIQELRAPPGRTCADVRAGRVQPIRVAAEQRDAARFRPSRQKNLCTVEIMAASAEPEGYLFGRYQRWTRIRPDQGNPDKVIDLGPRQGSVRWTVDIPERLSRGAVFRVFIFSTAREFTPSQRVLERLNRLDPRSDRLARLLERLRKRGIKLTMSQFRVIPDRLPRDRQPPRPDTYPPSPNDRFRPPPGTFPPPRG